MSNDEDEITMSKEAIAVRTYLDGRRENRPLSQPIVQGTIFSAASAESHAELFQSGQSTFYQRFGHPTSDAVAEKVAALEGAEAGLSFASGMAAISTTLMTLISSGGQLVVGNQMFDQTETFLKHMVSTLGISVNFVDTTDAENVLAAIGDNTTAVYVETPSNPSVRLSDIAEIAAYCKSQSAPLVVDSTFATPFGQSPLSLGASLVIHSGTKLLSGHMDVMCGYTVGEETLIARIKNMQRLLGGVLDPHAAWLALRGMKTLALRTRQIFTTSLQVAEYLSQQSALSNVWYPLHREHPQFKLAEKQMAGGGCVISFSVNGGRRAARRFVDSLNFIQIASSLGGVETVIELPYDLDWSEKAKNQELLVDLGQVRLSIGIEPADEIIADLEHAISRCALYDEN